MPLHNMSMNELESLSEAIKLEKENRRKELMNKVLESMLDLNEVYPNYIIEVKCENGVCSVSLKLA